jgi:hypothetical protein
MWYWHVARVCTSLSGTCAHSSSLLLQVAAGPPGDGLRNCGDPPELAPLGKKYWDSTDTSLARTTRPSSPSSSVVPRDVSLSGESRRGDRCLSWTVVLPPERIDEARDVLGDLLESPALSSYSVSSICLLCASFCACDSILANSRLASITSRPSLSVSRLLEPSLPATD